MHFCGCIGSDDAGRSAAVYANVITALGKGMGGETEANDQCR